jgi:hypothetical protein
VLLSSSRDVFLIADLNQSIGKEFDRMCLSRLFEHNYHCLQQRQQVDGYSVIFGGVGIIGDTSQVTGT